MDKHTEKLLREKLVELDREFMAGERKNNTQRVILRNLLTEIDRLRAQFSRLHEAATVAYLSLARESGTTDPERAEANQKATDEANSHLSIVLMETDKVGNVYPELPLKEEGEKQVSIHQQPPHQPKNRGVVLTREQVQQLLLEGRKALQEMEKRRAADVALYQKELG